MPLTGEASLKSLRKVVPPPPPLGADPSFFFTAAADASGRSTSEKPVLAIIFQKITRHDYQSGVKFRDISDFQYCTGHFQALTILSYTSGNAHFPQGICGLSDVGLFLPSSSMIWMENTMERESLQN